jgi:hypothetical protein
MRSVRLSKRTQCAGVAVHPENLAFPEDPARAIAAGRAAQVYRQIADQISGLIDAGEFPPGSRLPAERELALTLG